MLEVRRCTQSPFVPRLRFLMAARRLYSIALWKARGAAHGQAPPRVCVGGPARRLRAAGGGLTVGRALLGCPPVGASCRGFKDVVLRDVALRIKGAACGNF